MACVGVVQHFVVIETYIDQDGEACSDVHYAGSQHQQAEAAVQALDGRRAYHEDVRATVAVHTFPPSDAEGAFRYAVLEERGHRLYWKVETPTP